jgi:hypothetical protein
VYTWRSGGGGGGGVAAAALTPQGLKDSSETVKISLFGFKCVVWPPYR